MGSKADSRSVRLARGRRKSRVRSYLWVAALLGVLALFVAAVIALRNEGAPQQSTSFDYGPEDIAYDRPVEAVHEMESGPPIPFLPEDGPQPQIELNEAFHDFGSVGATEIVTREFAVANMGEAPLTISRAYTTCGCTTAEFTSTFIPPGMVSVVTVRFDAGLHDAEGQTVRRGVIMENNDPDIPQAEFWLEASVLTTG